MHIFFMTVHLQLTFLHYKHYDFQNECHLKAATRNFPFVLILSTPVDKSGMDTPVSCLKISIEQAGAFELVNVFITAFVLDYFPIECSRNEWEMEWVFGYMPGKRPVFNIRLRDCHFLFYNIKFISKHPTIQD